MSENLKLGQLIDTPQERDAIHIAVVPIQASVSMHPGTRVVLDSAGKAKPGEPAIGVVDPFLASAVPTGARFWLYLNPGSITSLRHEWTHPAFEALTKTRAAHLSDSEAWIAEHANLLGLSADVLMENAENWLQFEDYTVQHGTERWRDNFNPTEFWHHYEVVTGKVIAQDKKQSFYCCTC